jgi:hypothetical protein
VLDLAGEFAFLDRQLLNASRDRLEGELSATELGIGSAVGSSGGQAR